MSLVVKMMRLNSVKTILVLFFALPALAQNAPAPKPIDLLKQKLEQISAGVSADWGIYIKSLDTGEEIAINADKVMDTCLPSRYRCWWMYTGRWTRAKSTLPIAS
jgi:hypothetical protein